jgi:uncharacterized protein (TIGR03435 family)
VTATIAPGTTTEQADIMLRNLLIDQFKIKFHHTTKDALAYELTVTKSGSKLKEVTPGPTATSPQPGEYFNTSRLKRLPDCQGGRDRAGFQL